MKLSREVAYKYITIRTQYSSLVGVLAIPEPSDFPFCSAQRDSDSSLYVHVCTYVCAYVCRASRKLARTNTFRIGQRNIIQSIRRSVLVRRWSVETLGSRYCFPHPHSHFLTSSSSVSTIRCNARKFSQRSCKTVFVFFWKGAVVN